MVIKVSGGICWQKRNCMHLMHGEKKGQCSSKRATPGDTMEEFWGRKLLKALIKYNQLKENSIEAWKYDLDDLLDMEEDEGKDPENEVALEVRQRVDLKRTTVAFKRDIFEKKVKRKHVQKATVGSRKNRWTGSKSDGKRNKKDRHRRKRRRSKKERNKNWEYRHAYLSAGETQDYKDICSGWLPQMRIESELCYKRRRLKI